MANYSCTVLLLASFLFMLGIGTSGVPLALYPHFTDSVEETAPPPFEFPAYAVPAAPSDAPFVVYLKASRSSTYLCGGVLIGHHTVLTLASCILGLPLPQVVVGSMDNTKTTGPDIQIIEPREAVLHPSFLRDGHPNLAILKLNSFADVKPVDVPNRRFKIPEGVYLDMFGWGRLSSFSENSQALQNTKVAYVSKNRCSFAMRRRIPKHEICMGGDEAGSCYGSDGGPILCRDQLVGLIGRSHVCGQFGEVDVHLNIVPYANWIKKMSRS